jgi:hypothetical protein
MSLMSKVFGRVHWTITINKKQKKLNIYHLLIFNKLLTSSEHRNRNKPFYIIRGLNGTAVVWRILRSPRVIKNTVFVILEKK